MIRDEHVRRGERIAALRDALKADQLHDALAARDLPVSGTKAEQAARLHAAGYTLDDVLTGVVRDTPADDGPPPPVPGDPPPLDNRGAGPGDEPEKPASYYLEREKGRKL